MKTSSAVAIILLILVVAVSGPARAGARGAPSVAAQWVVAGMTGEACEGWKPGMGFNLSGSLPVGRELDLRADWGGRWLEGESRLITNPEHRPRWGGHAGETTEGLRVMPSTLDLVYRCECWSKGRFWIPYLATGPGFYDMRATFADAAENEREHTLFRFGWHVRGGVRLCRTSGMNVSLETSAHFIDTPGRTSTMWEAALGIGARVPGRTR